MLSSLFTFTRHVLKAAIHESRADAALRKSDAVTK